MKRASLMFVGYGRWHCLAVNLDSVSEVRGWWTNKSDLWPQGIDIAAKLPFVQHSKVQFQYQWHERIWLIRIESALRLGNMWRQLTRFTRFSVSLLMENSTKCCSDFCCDLFISIDVCTSLCQVPVHSPTQTSNYNCQRGAQYVCC